MAFDKLKNLFNVDIKDGLKGTAVVQSSSMSSSGEARMHGQGWQASVAWHDAARGGGPSPAAGGQPQVIDLRGTELAKLRDSGVLSQAEFEAEKARILAG